MRLMSCVGCVADRSCEIQNQIREQAKGLRITSLKHICKQRRPIFTPGQAVIFTSTYVDPDDDYGNAHRVRWPGHVVEQKGGKVIGFVAPGTIDLDHEMAFAPKNQGYVKIPLARVEADPSREPADATRCDHCGNHPRLGATCDGEPEWQPVKKCIVRVAP